MFKSNLKLIVLMSALFFIVFGCQFITEGKQKLSHYCPGLKITISGISYAFSGGRGSYIIDYEPSSQQAVRAYFEKQDNGFAEEKDGDFYNIELDNKPIIDRTDNILGKTFKRAKGNTEVIFNETTRRIIIIENSN